MKLVKYLLIVWLFFSEAVAYAQPAPPPPPDMESPLDVMVLVLLAAGLLYAAKGILSRKSKGQATADA